MTAANTGVIIRLLAETHIHVGVGQSSEAIDLPVAREKTTHFPFIPGSGVKGAFRVWANEKAGLQDEIDHLFGKGVGKNGDEGLSESAGSILFSDARLLLLPVRSINAAYKWVTCPALLSRFNRDQERAGVTGAMFDVPTVTSNHYHGKSDGSKLGLEEREFDHAGEIDDSIISVLNGFGSLHALKERLVILSDDDFVWFARFALPVMARNKLDENKKVVGGALWYEESLPPDTVMYLVLSARKPGAWEQLVKPVQESAQYIQMGGNETIGQGWFKLSVNDQTV
jgi:CRISPR-associated protein Cmr4